MIRSLSVRRVPRPLAVVLSVALAAVALPRAGFAGLRRACRHSRSTATCSSTRPATSTGPTRSPTQTWSTTTPTATRRSTPRAARRATRSRRGPWDRPDTAPPKADIGNVYKYIRSADSGDIELFFGWDRLAGQGTVDYYLELNKLPNSPSYRPNRTDGDTRFTLEDKGNGIIALGRIDIWTERGLG